MQTRCNIVHYRTDLHFDGYKLAIEIDGNRYSDRNIEHETKIQKEIEQGFGCKFVRIDPDKEDFDTFRAINEIFIHIKQSTKKSLINTISTRLLGLEFKSDNTIKIKSYKIYC